MIVALENQHFKFNKKGLFSKMNLSDLKRNKSCENLYHPKLNEKKKKLPRKKTIKIQFQKTIKSNEQKTKELTNQQNLNLLNAKCHSKYNKFK